MDIEDVLRALSQWETVRTRNGHQYRLREGRIQHYDPLQKKWEDARIPLPGYLYDVIEVLEPCPMCWTTTHNDGSHCSVCNPIFKKVKE